MSLYTIVDLLGDKIETLTSVYLHHCPDHIRNEMDRADAAAEGDGEIVNGFAVGELS